MKVTHRRIQSLFRIPRMKNNENLLQISCRTLQLSTFVYLEYRSYAGLGWLGERGEHICNDKARNATKDACRVAIVAASCCARCIFLEIFCRAGVARTDGYNELWYCYDTGKILSNDTGTTQSYVSFAGFSATSSRQVSWKFAESFASRTNQRSTLYEENSISLIYTRHGRKLAGNCSSPVWWASQSSWE